jgi:Subtilase family
MAQSPRKPRKPVHSRKARIRIGKARTKLDPRLAYLLSLPPTKLQRLKQEEDAALAKVAELIAAQDPRKPARDVDSAARHRRVPEDSLFAPLTAGVYIPRSTKRGKRAIDDPAGLGEPYFSVFILSDASGSDLKRLGAVVRCQSCDVFTAFVSRSTLQLLERSAGVRFIELARLWFYDLNVAIPFTQINTLHSAMPAVNGTGVIVGVVDSPFDYYHPDFRTAAGLTRTRFLWDQSLVPQAGEAGPPIAPALPGFTPGGGATYGVEYNQATIDAELAAFAPPATPAYQTVRHAPPAAALINGTTGHGTFVTGCAAGNSLGNATGGVAGVIGGAPGSTIIFVRPLGNAGIALAADNVAALDAFSYIFARAAQAGLPCVVNMSASDNQGPHDGTTLGEQFLDGLLTVPGRAITLSSGNSTGSNAHAAGTVPAGGTSNLVLNYAAIGLNVPNVSDDIEIWYDGHDRFSVTVTSPTAVVIGPVAAGAAVAPVAVGGVTVTVTSTINDPRNGDNLISIIITVPAGQQIPLGNWTIALTGTTVINGTFNAWVDRNNRFLSGWQAPFVQENQLTLGVPSTARRVITVGNHDKTAPTPAVSGSSGLGPTRDGRIKPEIATVGTNVTATRPRNMNGPIAGVGAQALYSAVSGTSFSSPIVAGACALLFQCRGAGATWADLKQILTDTAGTLGIAPVPGNAFGFGFLQMGAACARPATNVDVWLRDDVGDTGTEPFVGPVTWLCPDIAILDTAGVPVANPTFSAVARFNNIIRVTVRNRGTQTARNVDVFLYWGDPATNIPFPAEWRSTGIFTGTPGFASLGNLIVIPQVASGASTNVDFAWAPPAPGSNLRGDDHFCLLARLEHDADPSNIGAGGFTVVTASNNIGLHNVHVQP